MDEDYKRRYRRGVILMVFVLGLWLWGSLAFVSELIEISYEYEAVTVSVPRRLRSTLPRTEPIIVKKLWATYYDNTLKGCIGCKPYYDENGELYFIMSNGQRFDEDAFTVAANWVPKGAKLEVQWGSNVVVVDVTDRMLSDLKIDLSKAAFYELTGDLDIGSAFVDVKVIYLP